MIGWIPIVDQLIQLQNPIVELCWIRNIFASPHVGVGGVDDRVAVALDISSLQD